jgi:hypothetical protein
MQGKEAGAVRGRRQEPCRSCQGQKAGAMQGKEAGAREGQVSAGASSPGDIYVDIN